MSGVRRGVAIVHYERGDQLKDIVKAVKATVPEGTKVIVCDDGSSVYYRDPELTYIRGPNLGVAANKNRALFGLQDCHFLAIIEDDLMPTEKGWFEAYEEASKNSGIHHFCRVQDKLVEESIPKFSRFMQTLPLTPIYGPSPRGDFTFITSRVLREVGGFNPKFRGAGYAHGEWSERVVKAGLVPHPLKWVDILEARDKFKQVGDTTGGRWNKPKEEIDQQIQQNKEVLKELKRTPYIFHPLVLE